MTGLADAAIEHEGPSRLDPVVAASVLELRAPALTVVAQAFTFAGSAAVVGGVVLLLLLTLTLRGRLTQAATFAVGMGGSVLLTVGLKLWVARPRPPTIDRLGAADPTYSLPSGHTLNFVVLVVLAISLLWSASTWARRAALVAFSVVVIAGVAWSRVYLGYHWLTDIIASGLLALGWLSVVWVLRVPLGRAVERVRRRSADRALPASPRRRRFSGSHRVLIDGRRVWATC